MKKKKKMYLIIFCTIVLLTALTSYFIIQTQDNLNYLVSMPIEDIELELIEDGVYTGEYEVFPVSVILEIKVLDHEIIQVNILKHSNGKGEPAEVIINDVISNQSIEVDSIAGATFSSKVILLAIKDALN